MRETKREMNREFSKSCTTMHRTEERIAKKSATKSKLRDWKWKYRNQSVLKGKKSHLLDDSFSPLSYWSEMSNILLLKCSKILLSQVF